MPTLSVTAIDEPRRLVATCKVCKAGYRREARLVGERTISALPSGGSLRTETRTRLVALDGGPLHPAECCGRPLPFAPVKGVLNPSKHCDARCSGSKGPRCECACGGLCHGAGLTCV